MPNPSVPAAARCWPSLPSMPNVSRRSILTGSMAAVCGPSKTEAADGRFAELLADYRRAREAELKACGHADALYEAAELPPVAVTYGRRRFCDPETDEITWGTWVFHFAFEIDDHFGLLLEFWNSLSRREAKPHALDQDYERVMSELRAAEQRRADAERDAGISAANALADQASDNVTALQNAMFAFRPETMRDVELRNAFILELLRSERDLSEHLELIFGGGP